MAEEQAHERRVDALEQAAAVAELYLERNAK